MVASPLPDRDRRHLIQFYVAPKMGYRSRLVWAGSLILAGLAIQLLAFPRYILPTLFGLATLFAGNLFLLARGFNLRPQHRLLAGKWEKTTRDQFARMRELENEVKKWDESFTDLTCVSGATTLVFIAMAACGICALLFADRDTRSWAPLFLANAAVLFIPHWITGTRRAWRPVALRQQIEALNIALGIIDLKKSPPCQVQPMFEMAGKRERGVPIGARVFVRFPDGPDQFLGIQFQVALNNVQGTNYPYLYAVIVAKEEFGLLKNHLQQIVKSIPPEKPNTGLLAFLGSAKSGGLTVEPSRDPGVEVIVIRQFTTKQSGYHTQPHVIRRIVDVTWDSAASILSSQPPSSTSSS